MSKYVIVSFVEPEFPQTFSHADWPLHVTVLRPFSTNLSDDELVEKLQDVCARHSPITTEAKSKELFGPENDVSVTELVNTSELQTLHEEISRIFGSDIEFTAPPYPNYRPHVTDNNGKSIQVGDTVSLTTISLVALGQDDRTVLVTTSLTKEIS